MLALAASLAAQTRDPFEQARTNGMQFDEAAASMNRLLKAWLKHADSRTLLLPDLIGSRAVRLPDGTISRLYTPHNSGADLYPYLILTAQLTAPELYEGRLLEMLRNEIRFTTVQESIPANLEMSTGVLGPPSLFGAGEYAKDGLLAVTEYLGRTPWFYRMTDMVADAMNRAPVPSRFGKLPASDAELNGDFLQALVRLETMTGDPRFTAWARRIADAYMEEVLPGNAGVPSGDWDFTRHTGDGRLRLRDHGNETVVGLVLQFALEDSWGTPRAAKWRPAIARDARPHSRIGERGRPAVQRGGRAHAGAGRQGTVGQLGLRIWSRVHVLSAHRRNTVSRRRAPRSEERVQVPQLQLGASDRAPPWVLRRICRLDRERHLPGQSRTRAGNPSTGSIRR